MKTKFKRLNVWVKPSTVTQKGECCFDTTSIYLDRDDVELIIKQCEDPYKMNELKVSTLTGYIKEHNIELYSITIKSGTISNVILSTEELQYLCETPAPQIGV